MDDIWGVIPPAYVVNEDYEIFKEHGWDLGLSEFLHSLLGYIYLSDIQKHPLVSTLHCTPVKTLTVPMHVF